MVREIFSSNEVLEQKPQGSEEGPLETWGKSLPNRGRREDKGPEGLVEQGQHSPSGL